MCLQQSCGKVVERDELPVLHVIWDGSGEDITVAVVDLHVLQMPALADGGYLLCERVWRPGRGVGGAVASSEENLYPS